MQSLAGFGMLIFFANVSVMVIEVIRLITSFLGKRLLRVFLDWKCVLNCLVGAGVFHGFIDGLFYSFCYTLMIFQLMLSVILIVLFIIYWNVMFRLMFLIALWIFWMSCKNKCVGLLVLRCHFTWTRDSFSECGQCKVV